MENNGIKYRLLELLISAQVELLDIKKIMEVFSLSILDLKSKDITQTNKKGFQIGCKIVFKIK